MAKKEAEVQADANTVPPAEEAAPATAPAVQAGPKLVKMERFADYDGPPPKTADVHPDEVENFKAGGWQVSK